jgi:hypothetical protein
MLAWLDRDPGRLERHLTRHPLDADRLDQATALTDAQQQALRAATDVPTPILERLRVRLVSDPATTEALKLMAELMGVAWDTVRLMAPPGTQTRPGSQPGTHPTDPTEPSGSDL